MPTHESPLSSTHALPALSVTCRDRNSSRLWCVLMLRIAQREGGDSALAGYPVPRAKIGSRKIKIAWKREVGLRVVPLFSSRFSCSDVCARCHMRLALQLDNAMHVLRRKTERYGEKERGRCGGYYEIGKGNEMVITGGW